MGSNPIGCSKEKSMGKRVKLKKIFLGEYDVSFENKFIGKIKKFGKNHWRWIDFKGIKSSFVKDKRNDVIRPLLLHIIQEYPDYIKLTRNDLFIDALDKSMGIIGGDDIY